MGRIGFDQRGGAVFLELLSGMLVLSFEADNVPLCFLFEIPRPGPMGLETGSELAEQLNRLVGTQQPIHSPS
jgi:hypothetical protein